MGKKEPEGTKARKVQNLNKDLKCTIISTQPLQL